MKNWEKKKKKSFKKGGPNAKILSSGKPFLIHAFNLPNVHAARVQRTKKQKTELATSSSSSSWTTTCKWVPQKLLANNNSSTLKYKDGPRAGWVWIVQNVVPSSTKDGPCAGWAWMVHTYVSIFITIIVDFPDQHHFKQLNAPPKSFYENYLILEIILCFVILLCSFKIYREASTR